MRRLPGTYSLLMIPNLRNVSSARYMIFCGVPPHLNAILGMEKMPYQLEIA
jgi:hypothetical protein